MVIGLIGCKASVKIESPVMVSACLFGIRCRYDGSHSLCRDLVKALRSHHVIPFCPEQLGGLSTPRPPADMTGGDGRDVLSGTAMLINIEGRDVTAAFKKGAKESLRLARSTGSSIAIMKDKSPSCGLQTPLKGRGIGVTAALFESEGIRMIEMGTNDTLPRNWYSGG